ncbi:MAG: bacitracin ABC transporter ATP-binding protein, partial [Ruminiclostridium sp.]|nr:bacitracin ABC transporter ATP-binding protein [Ruminiclostridium sp.]
AILHHPKLLVLYEPTNGLDNSGIKELRDIFKRLAHEEGCTVFVSSHMLAELELMCDRVCVINHGVVIDNMTMEEIRAEKHSGDGRLTYNIDTPDKNAAIKIAEEMGVDYTLYDGQLAIMIEKENISKYIKKLALADVDIEGVIPVQKSLEDAFMEIIGDTPEGGVGQ